MRLKKTLIISSYAPPAIGGPLNMYNLLSTLPTDAYCILTSFYNIDNLSARMGVWLGGKYIFYDKPGATREAFGAERKEDVSLLHKGGFAEKLKLLVKRSALVKHVLGIPIILGQIIAIIRQGKKTIKNEGVEMLLGFSDYGPALIGTYWLHKLTHKPFSLFLFDLYRGNYFPFPGGTLALIFEPIIFRNAEKIVVTNEGTLEFYRKRYGEEIINKMVVIHNSVFPEPYLKPKAPYSPKPPYTILFTGRIYWPQIRSLKNLIEALKKADDLNIKLKIYCPNPQDYLNKIGIKEAARVSIDAAPPQEMPKIQGEADILFLPLSWGTKSQAIIDTATPGKLTDYLIAGKPMLIHAPSSSHLVQYAKNNGFAAVVDREDPEWLIATIKKMVQDLPYSRQLIENAQKTFFRNHDAHKNAEIFKSVLSS